MAGKLTPLEQELLDCCKELLDDVCFNTQSDFCECVPFEDNGECHHVRAFNAIAKAEAR